MEKMSPYYVVDLLAVHTGKRETLHLSESEIKEVAAMVGEGRVIIFSIMELGR